jgi:hypothetical protein
MEILGSVSLNWSYRCRKSIASPWSIAKLAVDDLRVGVEQADMSAGRKERLINYEEPQQ